MEIRFQPKCLNGAWWVNVTQIIAKLTQTEDTGFSCPGKLSTEKICYAPSQLRADTASPDFSFRIC